VRRSAAKDRLAIGAALLYLALSLVPILWMAITSFKRNADATSLVPKFLPFGDGASSFEPTLENYALVLGGGAGATGTPFSVNLVNSLVIGFASTLLAVVLATLAAYGFSRFPMKGKKDWLFFILSTRMLPPLAVVIPIFLMFSKLGLTDTHLGLVLLYAAFSLSLGVWLMKGFVDEIPREYEEAALVDGYTRLQAFRKVILPQAATGIATTAVFCLISAWNEFAFALILNGSGATPVPVFIQGQLGDVRGVPWGELAAGALLFVTPVVVFTFLVRKHLLRGVTFGAIKR